MVMGETHILKVVGSNPSNIYWMDIFSLICRKIVLIFLKKTENKRKRGRGWPIFEMFLTTFGFAKLEFIQIGNAKDILSQCLLRVTTSVTRLGDC